MIILGVIENKEYRAKYKKDNEKSKHFELRKDRENLVIKSANPLFYFEVLHKGERQVHVLYEDASLFVFNKETGLVITVILMSRKRMALYFSAANDYASEHPYTQRCAKIHDQYIPSDEELEDWEVKQLKQMKINHLRRGK